MSASGRQLGVSWFTQDRVREAVRCVYYWWKTRLAIRTAICDRLESEGYVVESVSDGDKGYRHALRNSYDILLLDGMLPKKSKFDVCRDLYGAA